MSDELVVPDWCPTCEPDTDPLRAVVSERYCYRHAPDVRGSQDDGFWSGLGTEDPHGVENKQWCDLIHRGQA